MSDFVTREKIVEALLTQPRFDFQHQDWGEKKRPLVLHKDGVITFRQSAEIFETVEEMIEELGKVLAGSFGWGLSILSTSNELIYGEKIWTLQFRTGTSIPEPVPVLVKPPMELPHGYDPLDDSHYQYDWVSGSWVKIT